MELKCNARERKKLHITIITVHLNARKKATKQALPKEVIEMLEGDHDIQIEELDNDIIDEYEDDIAEYLNEEYLDEFWLESQFTD